MSRSIDDLSDKMKPIAKRFVDALVEAGIPHAVIETLRTSAVQIAYYAQGREPLEEINAKRRIANLPDIKADESKRKVTWTLNSRHLNGDAMDVVPLTARGSIWWTAPDDVWERIGEIGESVGLEWGGRWKPNVDRPHFQYKA